MHSAIEVLYNEHIIIKSIIVFRDKISAISESNPEKYKEIVLMLIDFFRNYADKYHHYKEEKILFPLISSNSEQMKEGVVEEMLENHSDFREMVKTIEDSVSAGKFEDSTGTIYKYTEMLLDHIAVEDDELFQAAETLLDGKELDKVYFDFMDIDLELGLEQKAAYEKLPQNLNILGN